MSLKLVPFESLRAVSYSLSVVTVAVSVAVCEIFSVKEWRGGATACDSIEVAENRLEVVLTALRNGNLKVCTELLLD